MSFSYELYRNYSDALNKLDSLEALFCDEGHRLKNAYGSKTLTALGNCCAVRRLVLTGTPIQNNLEELYSVVHFAVPWYLGSLKDFKEQYADPITRHKLQQENPSAIGPCDAEKRLKDLLFRILIRRTTEDIMKSVLPRRTELIVRVGLSPEQRSNYFEETSSLSSQFAPDLRMSTVLPKLMRLRRICTKADEASHESMPPLPLSSSSADECGESRSVESLRRRSQKFAVVESLLLQIKQQYPEDKVIIASNFIENLEAFKVNILISNFY